MQSVDLRRTLRRNGSRWMSLGLAAALLPVGGCATLPLSSLGSIASLGDSSVSVGRDTYWFGKINTDEIVRWEDARAAAQAAAVDMGLKTKWPERVKGGDAEQAYVDDQSQQVGVKIEKLTPKLCHIRVDIGLIGPEYLGRLFLLRMRTHFPAPTAPHPTQGGPPNTAH